MAFPLFMVCVAAFLVASILAPAGLLWVAAWAWRSPSRRFRRMLGAAMAIVVVNIAVFGSISWLANRMSPPVDGPEPPGLLALLLVGVGMSFAAQWMIVKRATQAGAWRSLAVFLTWEFVSSAAGVLGAVVVRTTWMEAYVVPTGAMAPTILGVHAVSECPACAHPLAVGLSQRTTSFPSIGDESPSPLDVVCPNCAQGWQLPGDVATTSGDRVLVDKTAAPRRWDLVAYNTGDPPTVYAKRLIGLPGEQLTIAHGDVLINGMVLRKPAGQPDLLWLPLHDSRYAAAGAAQAGWRPAAESAGWSYESRHGWRFEGSGSGWQGLEFTRSVNDQSYYFPKDPFDDGRHARGIEYGDVRVDCQIAEFSGSGTVRLTWEFREINVVAEFSAAGRIGLLANDESQSTGTLERGPGGLGTVSLAVRDGAAAVLQDGRVIAEVELEALPNVWDALDAQPREPDPKLDSECRIGVQARNAAVTLSRIVVWRDVYYRNWDELDYSQGDPHAPVGLVADEYFLLGDLSAYSNDCRFSGPVRRDKFVGVVRCIYWPPGRWKRFR
jgi:signal peptidase I